VSLPLDVVPLRHPSSLIAPRVRFANSSEEIFARLLSLYGVEWVYEPVEFPLAWDDGGRPVRGFRPDFYLPAWGGFVELTVLEQRLVTRKNRKVRDFRVLYPEIPLQVIYRGDFCSLLRRHGVDVAPVIGRAA
jgi:hypothetical protein